AVYMRFRKELAPLLVAEEPHRDHITLLVEDLGDVAGLHLWLEPPLPDLPRRKGRAALHVAGGARTTSDAWAAARRGGAPRTPEWVLDQLTRSPVLFRNLLLRVWGPNAGAFLALEAGLHRWTNVPPDRTTACLLARHIAMRSSFDDEEWSAKSLVP